MSTAQVTWQRQNTRQVGLRLNCNQDSDIIAYLDASGSPTQTIRRLIRDEIARTGWTPSAPAPSAPSLSLDGGETWIPLDALDDAAADIAARWDEITAAMDPQLYEDTDANFSPCPLPEFLRHYLEASGQNLIV